MAGTTLNSRTARIPARVLGEIPPVLGVTKSVLGAVAVAPA
jgi:hypothetical protein